MLIVPASCLPYRKQRLVAMLGPGAKRVTCRGQSNLVAARPWRLVHRPGMVGKVIDAEVGERIARFKEAFVPSSWATPSQYGVRPRDVDESVPQKIISPRRAISFSGVRLYVHVRPRGRGPSDGL